jgi:predicted nucleotidyltransferase
MRLRHTFAAYQDERDQQLARILALLAQDERVQSAWLFGSLGRGSADALSDIDLIMVAGDADLPAVIAGRYAFAERLGSLLFTLEAPQNAPTGGAYLMACYDAPTAPHILDLYWQPASLAWDASQARLLFQRSGAQAAVGAVPSPSSDPAPAQGLPHAVRHFWMMLLIAAKYVCREPNAAQLRLLPLLAGAYKDIRQSGVIDARTEFDPLLEPVSQPRKKIALLRRLAQEAGTVPGTPEGLLSAVERYLMMAEGAI